MQARELDFIRHSEIAMYHFTADDMQQGNPCAVCCCQDIGVKPGSTSKISVNYAPWGVPIGRLHCQPSFDLEQKETCGTNTGGPLLPADPIRFDTPINATLNGDLKAMVTDPGGGTLTFKPLSLYGPSNGTLDLDPTGLFIYKPNPGYTGADRFFASATSPNGKTTNFEVLVGVDIVGQVLENTPHVSVVSSTVNYQYYTASFAVKVSPAADLCEIWRLTVKMQALDCDCTCYDRTDCFDIRMVKC